MKPSTYLVGILVFTAFIMGGLGLMSILRDSDATFAQDAKFSQFNETFNVYDETESKVSALGSSISDSENQHWGALGVLNSLILSAWQTLRLLLTNFAFMNTVFNGLSTFFGVPTWVSGLIISGVTVVIVFGLYAAIFQREL